LLKIILTNDDGIDAPGLKTLCKCLHQKGELIVVAPRGPQSGIAHKVTTRVPVQVDEVGKNRYSVHGTPADCTRIALKKIAPDADWVIAGINPGANLGSDVYNSGTVAAAREAAILGVKAIAISQYIARDNQIDWDITGHCAEMVLKMLVEQELLPEYFWNVNLPHPLDKDKVPAVKFCGLDTNPHFYDYTRNGNLYEYLGSIHARPREPGRDVHSCFEAREIAITRIAVGTTKMG